LADRQRALTGGYARNTSRQSLPRDVSLGISSTLRNLFSRDFTRTRKLLLKPLIGLIRRNVQTPLNGLTSRCGRRSRTARLNGLSNLPRSRSLRDHVIDHPETTLDERSDGLFV
jgi:hypothetical protein